MKQYTIKEGNHRSGIYFRPHFEKTILRYNVTFGESCIYDLGNENQADINKLCGISFGLHHNNSARFGWACVGGMIELFAYCYVNKKRVWKSLGLVDVGKTYELHLDVNDKSYHFWVYSPDEPTRFKVVDKTKTCKWGYMLYPYFGGDEVAPHDIHIALDTVMRF